MVSKLVEYGDEVALVLDRELLDKLNITLDTPLDVSVEDQTIRINPVRREVGPDEIEDSLEKINKRYARALKRLAN